MPGLDDWIGQPIQIIEGKFDQQCDHQNYLNKIQEYFQNKISTETICGIPSLNSVPLHNLKSNSLVRFRCMIQDMYDPEFYLGMYEMKDVKTGNTTLHSGMWKDLAQCGPHEELLFDSSKNKTMDRQTLYCVPIPGECKWTKELFNSQVQATETPSTSCNLRQKRSLDDSDESQSHENDCIHNSSKIIDSSRGEDMEIESKEIIDGSDTKKSKAEEANGLSAKSDCSGISKSTINSALNLNFPLPDEKGPACLVKIYDSVDAYKVNDMVEFIGILSNDPAMVDFPKDVKQDGQLGMLNPADMMMESEEHQIHHPPPSLVPRLHVILSKKLTHCNPLLPEVLDEDACKSTDIQHLLSEATAIREKLLAMLKDALYGDLLAAEYMLCHLISNVYARHDVSAVGKFSLNLRGCPKDIPFPTNFYLLLENLLPKSQLVPLTVQNLNTTKFTPFKDYEANRLISGKLQLSDNTEIVIDETVMQPGQLDTTGVRNLTALGNVITWQKVEYDFNYHKQDFYSNFSVLVMSEGKSLLECDSHLTLSPQTVVNNIEEHMKKINQSLTPEILKTFRSYLTLVQLMPYGLSEDMQKDIENDFVEIRKENPESMTVEDFQALLVLARLISKSYGKVTLDKEVWEKSKQLEHQRKLRMQVTATTA